MTTRKSTKKSVEAVTETKATHIDEANDYPTFLDFSGEEGQKAKSYLDSPRPEGYISFTGLIITTTKMVKEGLVEAKVESVPQKSGELCKVVSMTTDILKTAIARVLAHRESHGHGGTAFVEEKSVTPTEANNTILAAEKFLANAKEYNPGLDLGAAEGILASAKDKMKSLVLDPSVADFTEVKEAAEVMFLAVHVLVNTARESSVRRQLSQLPRLAREVWECQLEVALAESDLNDRRKAIGAIGSRLAAAGYRDPEWKPLPSKRGQQVGNRRPQKFAPHNPQPSTPRGIRRREG